MVIGEKKDMEKVLVAGVAYNKNEARITLRRVPDRPGIAAQLFGPISDAGIVVDMIIQNTSEDGFTDMPYSYRIYSDIRPGSRFRRLIHGGKS